jgi:hypothetical protein
LRLLLVIVRLLILLRSVVGDRSSCHRAGNQAPTPSPSSHSH